MMTSYQMGGEDLFVMRGDHTPVVTVRGQRIDSDSDRTEVTLKKDGDTWHFDKLKVAGEGEAYRFSAPSSFTISISRLRFQSPNQRKKKMKNAF